MRRISVLHISHDDGAGGAGRSAYKIHKGLVRLGIDSKMLVGVCTNKDNDIDRISKGFLWFMDKAADFVTQTVGLHYFFYPSSFALFLHPWFKEADIVQIYNIHGGYFTHTALPFISKRKRVVWRLSDMWPTTGHCAYSGECEGWLTGCTRCRYLTMYPSLSWDTSAFLWQWKKSIYARSSIHLVVPSSWMKNIVENSPLLKDFNRNLIPNGVDTTIFKPMPKDNCRNMFAIAQDAKVVLFLAYGLKNNPRKGGEYFIRAMNTLFEQGEKDILIMLVGYGAEIWGKELKYPVFRYGYVDQDNILVALYNCADVLVHPAIMENLPNSILEAMSCGLPVVTFDVGGVKDAVRHMESGYLVNAKDNNELVHAIRLLLNDSESRLKMGVRSRDIAVNEYSAELQAQRFARLYNTLITT